jgi:hypothetical protein
MIARFRSDDEGTAFDRDNRRAGLNSPFSGSQSKAQLAAEIGCCLQSRYSVPSKEPLPEKLVALVNRLQERDRADQAEPSEADATRTDP